MRRLSPFVAIVIAVIAFACGLSGCGRNKANHEGSQHRTPQVGVVTISPQRAVLTTELPGRTLPFAVSDVRPQVSGILKQRLFTEGGLVSVGQPLYQIDAAPYQAAYDSAKAQLASAKATLTTAGLKAKRYASLRKDKMISQQDDDDAQAALEEAQAKVAQQQAEVEAARINLDYTRIVAPIAGKISRSYLTQGALVTANQVQALATIQTLDPMYVDMNQSASELLALRQAIAGGRVSGPPADTADVTLNLDDGTRYSHHGTLQFSEVAVDSTTGTVTLRAQFPNPDGVLLPGMFVRATIIEGVEPDALLVPQRGVSRDAKGNATALIVDAGGVVRQRMLKVPQTVGTNWLVRDGLEAGDRVIVEGLQYARPGEKARAVPFDASANAGDDQPPAAGKAAATAAK